MQKWKQHIVLTSLCSLLVGVTSVVQAMPFFPTPFFLEPLPAGAVGLPIPKTSNVATKVMTLSDAIYLAMRSNPGVRSATLSRVTQKFSLAVAFNEFEPQYSASGGLTLTPGAAPSYTANTSVSLKTPIGTQFTIANSNSFGNGHSSSVTFTVKQDLLKGFGSDINLIGLRNNIDAEKINRLTYRNTIMQTITTVVADYYRIVSGINQMKTTQEQLRNDEQVLKNTELKIKLGKSPPSDAVNQKSTIYRDRLSVVSQENQVQQDYQTLLTTLGLDPYAHIHIVTYINFHKYKNYKIPPIDVATHLALLNSTAYQQGLMTLRADKRALLQAKDNMRPTLTMTGTDTQALSSSGSLATTNSNTQSLVFAASIPIDDMSLKEALVSAQIGLRQQKIELAQTKRNVITTVKNSIRNLVSQKEQVHIAEQSADYQEQTYRNILLQYNFGKIDSYTVQQESQGLVARQRAVIANKIEYINQVTAFQQLIGVALRVWDLKVRY